MQIKYTGRHFQIDDQLKEYAEEKAAKLIRFLEEPIEIQFTLEAEKHRQIAEVHASHRHGVMQSKEESDDMRDSVHDALDKVEKQARRARKKFMDRRRRAQRSHAMDDHHWPLEVIDAASLSGGKEKAAEAASPRVIKTTRLPIKPKTIDEAALDLESSKNDFHVFLDSSSAKVSVIYRRNDGNLGLIAPEF